MLALGLAALTAGALLAPAEVVSAYRQQLAARYATQGTPIPAGGVEFAIDSARFRLDAGEIRAMEPVAGGRVTGLVFRGRGRLELELPDPRELDELRRTAELPDAKRLETEFTKLVLRDGGGLVEGLLARLAARRAGGAYAPDPIALDRQEVWLERQLVDADAWASRALAGDGAEWALADVDAGELGWLTIEFDPDRAEELQVSKFRPEELATEIWVSLDRASERGADGRPASTLRRQVDLLHARIQVDLRKPSKEPRAGASNIQPRRARFEVELRLQPLRPAARTLAFELDPWSELESVRDERGTELLFLRDHVGKRSSGMDDRLWDNTVIVLLPEPIGNAERRLTFVTEGDILNYVGGRNWYPGEDEAQADPHTAELEITALPKHDVRAMGRLVESRDDAKSRFRRFVVDRPVRAVTFSYAEKFEEQRIENAGAPPVVAFSAIEGTRDKAHNVGVDVSNAWCYFAERFGPGPEMPELYATSIVGGHGQAFDGFLHLGEPTWLNESRGPTELFRAHEVAHEWWGQLVGWSSYRDQWLSEAFANYSSMRFVEATLDEGPKLYREIVEGLAASAMGESKVSRFQRGFRPPQNRKEWARVGPISLGYRAATGQVRDGYTIQSYDRGALVLHMLRRMLAATSGSDELFDQVLADFARDFRGREASTADFVAVLARRTSSDWSWFFREWVDETAIPTWTWSWRPGTAEGGGAAVVVDVEQTGVGPGFRMPVPIRIESDGGESREVSVEIDQPHETFTIPVERPAKRLVFDPELAVLARVVRR